MPASSMEMVKACSSRGKNGCVVTVLQLHLGRAKADAEGAPMAAADEDRRGQVFDQHEIAAAHVAAIGLQQKTLRVVGDLLHGAVVVNAPVAAMGRVPDRVVALRLTVVGVVRGQVAALRPGNT